MPFLLTDAEAGQRAMLDMDLNPLRAQAEAERIPLETQRMQQNLETGKINQQAAVMQMQALVEAQTENKEAKQVIGDLVKDPNFASLSLPDQQKKIGTALTAKGIFGTGEKFLKDSQQSRMTDANIKKTEREIDQFHLEQVNTYLSGMNTTGSPDDQQSSLNRVMMGVKADGLMTPKQQQAFEKNARDALASGHFPQWKKEAMEQYNSLSNKKLIEQTARDQEKALQGDRKYEADQKKFELLLARATASSNAKDAKGTKDTYLKIYTDAGVEVRAAQDDLRNAEIDLAKLPPEPKDKEWLGFGDVKPDPNKEMRASKVKEIKALNDRIKEYSGLKQTARRQLMKEGVDIPVVPESTSVAPPPPSDKDASTSELPTLTAESAQAEANKAGKPIRAVINGRAATITPLSKDTFREDLFSRGDKLKDGRLQQLRALIESKDPTISTKAYIDYEARVRALEQAN